MQLKKSNKEQQRQTEDAMMNHVGSLGKVRGISYGGVVHSSIESSKTLNSSQHDEDSGVDYNDVTANFKDIIGLYQNSTVLVSLRYINHIHI